MSVYYLKHGEDDRGKFSSDTLLGPLSVLARQRKTWSPILLTGVLWRAVCNVPKHRQVLDILKYPEFAELARLDPRFPFKYLTHDYLSRGLTVAERVSCFTNHYRWMRDNLPNVVLAQILHRTIPLIEIWQGLQRMCITFGLTTPTDKEGELSLNLQADGETVFALSFTIVPGEVVKSQAADVLLITRIQGTKIASAIKAFREVRPTDMLIAALQGLGEAFGIRAFACISATDQSSYCSNLAATFRSRYDDFFLGRGIIKNEANFFVSPIPMCEKPLALIKQGHKLRAKRRHALKRMIAEAARQALYEFRHGHDVAPMQVRFDPRIG
jgi:uncharacterized protein VirK/YbjX